MNMSQKREIVLDNGLPRCNIPWRSESGRVSNKADTVVIMRKPCKIGTWNIRTLLTPGKVEEVKMEMERLNIDILGLSEVRWEGSGDYWSDNYRIIYSGENQGANGTAVVLNRSWGLQIENTIHLGDRITALKLKTSHTDLFIVQVYMPTGNHDDDEVEAIYNNIDSILNSVKDKDNLIVMGDFNAVVGKGSEDNIVGKFGLGQRNCRGRRLIQFCKENDLIVANTMFDLPKRRLYTWKMPGDIGRYQLDYILTKNGYRNHVKSCKTLPGADLNTDHNLLVSTFIIDIKKQKKKFKRKRIDLNKLKDKNFKVQYSNKLGIGLQKLKENYIELEYNNMDIETRWEKVKDIIKTSADEVLQKEKLIPRKKWLTPELIKLMTDRRKLKCKTDEFSIRQYRQLTNKITSKCREQKTKYLEETCNSVETLMKQGKIDKAYSLIKQLDSKPRSKSTAILDEKGKILVNNKDIAERWKRYIEELYRGQGMKEDDIEKVELVPEDKLGPIILREEFMKAMNSIQHGKAPGEDHIYIELIKYAVCDPLLDEMYYLIGKMYETGTVPQDFQISRTVTLPKKQNTLKCEEHRTLCLVSQASKVLLKIVQNRIRPHIENYLGPDQYGFRQNKGTREAVLALRLIIDRRMDLTLPTCIAFIDLEKAFDRVNWTKMMDILKEVGIDYRDRRIIYQLYKNQKTVIEVGEEKQYADIKQGVRQGCPLSPLIFNIFIEYAIRKIVESGKGGVKFNGETIRFIRFADDIAAIADTTSNLEQLLTIMNNTFEDYGLSINCNKTKILITSKSQSIASHIEIHNNHIKQVESFKYLGSRITQDSRCSPDIVERIAIAKQAYNRKKHLFKAKININIKKQLIKTYIWSIALYGCETWTLTQRDRDKLAAFEMWCWRRMMNISWTEKKSNEEVLLMVDEERRLLNTVDNRRGKMVGHLIRHDNLFKTILEGKIEGRRKRGRPRLAYIQQLKEKVGVVAYQDVKRIAENRQEWRLLHRQGTDP